MSSLSTYRAAIPFLLLKIAYLMQRLTLVDLIRYRRQYLSIPSTHTSK
eukprot:UN09220